MVWTAVMRRSSCHQTHSFVLYGRTNIKYEMYYLQKEPINVDGYKLVQFLFRNAYHYGNYVKVD